jgi:hypothetical protein
MLQKPLEERIPMPFDICLLDQDNASIEQVRNYEHIGKSPIKYFHVYDLANIDLTHYIGLMVPGIIDQEFLYTKRQIIRGFLDSKKVVVFNGHLFRNWLPNASNFIPKKIKTFKDYYIKIVKDHAIFEGVSENDLTFRKGVAGFFARGHHPPPEGSEILLTFNTGEPILYIDRKSTKGTILVHSGNDLLAYAGEENSSGRIAYQLIKWIYNEFDNLQWSCKE